MVSWLKLRFLAPLAFLACCSGPGDQAAIGQNAKGRYSGIGTYPAGALWKQRIAKDLSGQNIANLADDDQIIVSLDSLSGEIRQCGNLSGRCVKMDPWHMPVGGAENLPAVLIKTVTHRDTQAADGKSAAKAPNH